MTWINLHFKQIILPFFIALTLIGAYDNSPLTNTIQVVSATPPPPPPPDRGAPGGRKGAASRGLCPRVDTPLTALMPEYKTLTEEESVWGLTFAKYPTFWFYLPYSLTPQITAEFTLQSEDKDNTIYNTKIPFTTTATSPGIVSIRLPSTVQPIEIGKRYYWKFVVHCHPQDPSANIFVDGWVERTAPIPTLQSQLEKATPRERVSLYVKQGLWYESVTTLAELRRTYPQDAKLADDWAALLEAVDLKAIASKPIVQCCTPEK